MYCKKCGNQLSKNDSFCPVCGAMEDATPASNYVSPKKQNNPVLVALVVILAVAVLVLIIALLQKSNQPVNQQAINPPTPSAYSSSVVGNYQVIRAERNGEPVRADEIPVITLTINADGTAIYSVYGSSTHLRWTQNGDAITLTDPESGVSRVGTVNGNYLTGEMDDVVVTFFKR